MQRFIHMVSPDELLADGAEGGLAEEDGAELMVLDLVDLGLLDGPSAPGQGGQPVLRDDPHRRLTRDWRNPFKPSVSYTTIYLLYIYSDINNVYI